MEKAASSSPDDQGWLWRSILVLAKTVAQVVLVSIMWALIGFGVVFAIVKLGLWVVLGIFVAIIVIWILWIKYQDKRATAEAFREQREHEAWLQSPAGKAWQEEEHKKVQRQQAENERKRKEAEESAAREKWRQYFESKTMIEISQMNGRQFEEFLARLFSRMGFKAV